jgi:hypothetical protein
MNSETSKLKKEDPKAQEESTQIVLRESKMMDKIADSGQIN